MVELMKIPRPEFIVVYNGKAAFPPEKTLRLSDAYMASEIASLGGRLELDVRVININEGNNGDIVRRSETLSGYVMFITKANGHVAMGMELEAAIRQAATDCIEAGVLVDFLTDKASEVINMLTMEWDWDRAKEVWQTEAKTEGKIEGKMENKLENARAMLKDRVSISRIAKYTGLSIEEIQALKANPVISE